MDDFSQPELTLHEKLQQLAIETSESALTVDDALQRLATGVNGYGIPLLLLALPGALPMPALGLSSLLGVIVVLLGLQMFIGRHTIWLPRWFIHTRLRADWCQRAARLGGRFLPALEHLVKPRMRWSECLPCASLLGLVVILLGLLMVLPVPGTNTPPAIILFVLSVALIENDGLLTMLMGLMTLFLVLLYAEVIYFLIMWLAGLYL